MTAPLPTIGGRPVRIVLLVYRDADTDSRVLKSAATLGQAGAEVLVIGLAPYFSGLPEGECITPEGVRLHRTRDLDLVRTFARTARVWRRLRGRDPVTGAVLGATVPGSTVQVSTGRVAGASAATKDGAPAVIPRSRHGAAAHLRRLPRQAYLDGYRVARLVRYWAGAVRVAHRFGADVVHANDGNTLAPALVLRLLRGSRLVYDSHELWLRRNVRPRVVAPLVEALLEGLGVRMADAVITVSPSIADWLQRHYRLPQRPLLVRNIPVWAGQVPSPTQGRLRELTGLGPQAKIVSYCGGITSGRGLEETIDALALLPADVHLVLLGFGPSDYLRKLLERAHGAHVGDRVHLAGTVPSPQVTRTLADADLAVVYVRPIVLSYRYSLPNKLFESIHAGLPIVAADLPDTAELVRAHGVGEVSDSATPADLAMAMRRVFAHPDGYRRNAIRLAPTLDWRHEAVRLLEAHTRAVGRCRA